jgi:hypothetical protein
MWGWKAAERLIEPGVPFDEAKQQLQQHGFEPHASHPGYALFRRLGADNPWTTPFPEVGEVPLELALAPSHSGLFLQLRYGTFVLFDTGDLEQLADAVADLLNPVASLTRSGDES